MSAIFTFPAVGTWIFLMWEHWPYSIGQFILNAILNAMLAGIWPLYWLVIRWIT